ncbi:MAG TPA: hypothetical protein VLB27_02585, partial [candidate division Zixibacteria bacterium]|nr:hypothetical protein [candidate division Zixibacteria bacterium]
MMRSLRYRRVRAFASIVCGALAVAALTATAIHARRPYAESIADSTTGGYEINPNHQTRIQTVGMPMRATADGVPFVDVRFQSVGNIQMSIRNDGAIGPDTYLGSGLNSIEEFMEFPLGSQNAYPTPRLVVGGVVGRDTLVSWVQEWWPPTLENQIANDEGFIIRSVNDTGSLG